MEIPSCRTELKHPPPQRRVITLIFLLSMFRPLSGVAQTAQICFGDPAHPVVAGEAWLIVNRWGAYQGVLVATIRHGTLEARPSVQLAQYWEQAYDYKLLLAVADHPVAPAASLVEDFAYTVGEAPEYLRRFSTIYLSPPLAAEKLGRDWPAALEQIGHLAGTDLVLPPPRRRTIRLLYPDGRPLGGQTVPISLYGSSENHCGVAVGIKLGVFTTNADGEVSVVAPRSPLALLMSYYEMKPGGAAGNAFFFNQDVIIGSEPVITVKRLWTLPQHDYVLHLRTAENQPIPYAHLTACMNFDGCGAGCGPIRAPESDSSGTIRFREEDLRELRSITVVSKDGKERNLTGPEMRDLLLTCELSLIWN